VQNITKEDDKDTMDATIKLSATRVRNLRTKEKCKKTKDSISNLNSEVELLKEENKELRMFRDKTVINSCKMNAQITEYELNHLKDSLKVNELENELNSELLNKKFIEFLLNMRE